MLSFLPAPVRGVLAALLLVLNTLIHFSLLLPCALLKLLPIKSLQVLCTRVMIRIAESWMLCNSAWMRLSGQTQWDIQGHEQLKYEGWYLVTSNHRSWVDILALQHTLNRRMPMLKFFLKQELIWVPVIGLCWWALDFPFMKRYSKTYLAKHPEKAGQDLETTRKACAKFKNTPVAVFNFLEGTRLTPAKHAEQQSPYHHLLKPKSGGVAFVLDAMGNKLRSLVDITIHYPDGSPSFWDLLCGRIRQVVMRCQIRPIPGEFLGQDYQNDAAFRERFQQWVNGLWEEKDALLAQLHSEYPPLAGRG
ncbi:acyltransferase [Pseudomonas jilinensis]|uniref:Acyltransferase n=1 Tax=Pseudomonas jilinensis TaxID=2078689 RepID=A0A396S7U8_9PSED|nr:acyltransferase [Pseudomonas jilinensis]RHW22845.1 acyltransferase [Pseudomonas jilinensis]